jgi:hypothetical protein
MVTDIYLSYYRDGDGERAEAVARACRASGLAVHGVVDALGWLRLGRDGAVKEWIERELAGTAVTVVLVTAATGSVDVVKYEVKKSYGRGNGLVAVRVHGLPGRDGTTDEPGANPLDEVLVPARGDTVPLAELCALWDWVDDDGASRVVEWVEHAARRVPRTLSPTR